MARSSPRFARRVRDRRDGSPPCRPRTGNAGLQATQSGGESQSRLLPVQPSRRRIALAPGSRRTRNHRTNPLAMNIASAHLDALSPSATPKQKPAFSTSWRRIPATLWRVNSSPSPLPIGATERTRSGANFTPRNTREQNAFRRAERSITSSRAGSIARSNARTSAIAGNTKSNTFNGASECSIMSSPTRSGDISKPSRKKSPISADN